MDILFENSYIRNKALAKELYGYIYFRRNYLFIAYIVLLISFIINLILLIITGTAENWFVFVFVPLFIGVRLLTYFNAIKLMTKRDNELYGGAVEVKTIVTDEFIQNTSSTGSVNKLEYGKIKKVNQTKNLILLRSDANLIYVFTKNGFSLGTTEEFLDFLRNKGIKVK